MTDALLGAMLDEHGDSSLADDVARMATGVGASDCFTDGLC
jgi:hypothetical protein